MLVEGYARVRWPERFGDVVPIGRTADLQTRAGWPDALARVGGQIEALEASHAKTNWRRHLSSDVKRADIEGLTGFVFVSWCAAPPDKKLKPFRDALLARGLPAERVNFVFREELVSSLRQPRFARLWQDPLGLATTALPFVSLRNAPIYGDDRSAFTPSLWEYEQQLVHRPKLADRVTKELAQRGWSYVRGRGAAGKTALAAAIGLSRDAELGMPAYYLDLGGQLLTRGDLGDAMEAMTSRSDMGVLWIVDNAHLDPEGARRLFVQWQATASGSKFLLLGREMAQSADVRGLAAPLQDFDAAALVLVPREAEVEGVLRRLSHRYRPDERPPQPKFLTLCRWSDLFSGDLVALATAIRDQHNQLAAGSETLTPAHAAAYVRQTYIEPLDAASREALRTVAALSAFEVGTPHLAVPTGALERSIADGIVHYMDATETYEIVHPGLARLIAEADATDAARLIVKLAETDHAPVRTLLRRVGRDDVIVQALRNELHADPDAAALFTLLTPTSTIATAVNWMGRFLDVDLAPFCDTALAQYADECAALISGASCPQIANDLTFVRRHLPHTYARVMQRLKGEQCRTSIASTVASTSPELLVDVVPRLLRELPEIENDLTPRVTELAQVSLARPSKRWQWIVRADLSQDLAARLDAALVRSWTTKTWYSLFQTKGNVLLDLATHAQVHFPRFYELLRTPPPDVFVVFSNGAFPRSGMIPSFLLFADRHNPDLIAPAVDALLQGPAIRKLARGLWRRPSEAALACVTVMRAIAPAILDAIVRELEREQVVAHLALPLSPRRAAFVAALGPDASRRLLRGASRRGLRNGGGSVLS